MINPIHHPPLSREKEPPQYSLWDSRKIRPLLAFVQSRERNYIQEGGQLVTQVRKIQKCLTIAGMIAMLAVSVLFMFVTIHPAALIGIELGCCLVPAIINVVLEVKSGVSDRENNYLFDSYVQTLLKKGAASRLHRVAAESNDPVVFYKKFFGRTRFR